MCRHLRLVKTYSIAFVIMLPFGMLVTGCNTFENVITKIKSGRIGDYKMPQGNFPKISVRVVSVDEKQGVSRSKLYSKLVEGATSIIEDFAARTERFAVKTGQGPGAESARIELHLEAFEIRDRNNKSISLIENKSEDGTENQISEGATELYSALRIRLVSSDGEIITSGRGEASLSSTKLTGSANSSGWFHNVLFGNNQGNAKTVEIDNAELLDFVDNTKIFNLAIDKALRDMLPGVDRYISSH